MAARPVIQTETLAVRRPALPRAEWHYHPPMWEWIKENSGWDTYAMAAVAVFVFSAAFVYHSRQAKRSSHG